MDNARYVSKGENKIAGKCYFQMFAMDKVNHTQHIHCYKNAYRCFEK